MSDSQRKPWSNNPNAPKIPYDLHHREKSNIIENFISSIFMVHARHSCLHVRLSALTLSVWLVLGVAIMLFSKCMAALFNPTHRRSEHIKRGLVSYTPVMFSLVTVHSTVVFEIQSISHSTSPELLFCWMPASITSSITGWHCRNRKRPRQNRTWTDNRNQNLHDETKCEPQAIRSGMGGPTSRGWIRTRTFLPRKRTPEDCECRFP